MKPTTQAPKLMPPVSDRDHSQGPKNAPVTLVEYGDFECPHCGRAHGVVKAVQARFEKKLRFVFRHFPLRQVHPNAENAAEAAEAAGVEGKFWEMHDTLFENQDALEPEDLIAYAEELGLDAVRVAEELRIHAHAPRVQEDFLSGVRSGVNGTPTFFINGSRHDGPFDEAALVAAIELELQA